MIVTSLFHFFARSHLGQSSLLAAFLLLALGAGSCWYLNQPTGQPAQEIHIPSGMSAYSIGLLLENKGLIRSGNIFALAARLKGLEAQLKAGVYQLSGTKTTFAMIQDLLRAPMQAQRITIPEGLTRCEIAGLLARSNLVDSLRFVALTEDSSFVRRLGIEAPTLEGYLFPETYFFAEKTSEEEIIRRMVGEFHRVLNDSLRQRLQEIGINLHEAVTLASIVEREAKVQEERPIIAGIFLKRLGLNQRLESCVTVEYALGLHKEHLTYADLQIDSPFNTYRYPGLPPGPIGNPGRAAILATLYPSETDFFFFVARGDGTHIFSRTSQEHEQAKQAMKYLMRYLP